MNAVAPLSEKDIVSVSAFRNRNLAMQ
jgi:hypothetical protein